MTEKTIVSTAGQNQKLGIGVASTSRRVGYTCPPDCALMTRVDPKTGETVRGACYAFRGRTFFTLGKIEKREHGDQLEKANGAALIRHLVTGDWLKPTKDGRKVVDRDHARRVLDWHRKPTQRFTIGWGYTHAAERMESAGFGPADLPENLQIMASCDNLEQARRRQQAGWKTARVISHPDEKQSNEIFCPYDLAKYRKAETDLTCASCRKCLPGANLNIVFLKF